jgi:predicted dehydrogenase
MTAQLRVGLIGLGRMGRHHARVLRTLDGILLVGVLDPQGDLFRAADGVPLAADLDALIGIGLDYAVLACPTLLHEPIGLVLAAAGIPTLIEKPLAGDPAAARRLADAFHAAGVPAAVGYIERFNPALIALRQRVQRGQLGDVFSVATSRTGPYPVRVTDVGVIHDLATHDLDLTAWLAGSSYTSISARTAYRSGRPYEDLLAAVGQLADGTITHHQVNWLSPLKARATTVTGDRGILVADTLTSGLTYWANHRPEAPPEAPTAFRGATEGDTIHFALPQHDPLTSEHEAFRDLVMGLNPRLATLQDGLHAVLTAHAALHASHTGDTTPVPSLPCGRPRARPDSSSDNPIAVPGTAPNLSPS